MPLPNGNLLQVIREEEKRAAELVKRSVINAHNAPHKIQPGTEVSVSEIIGKIDGLEMRMSKRVARPV